MADELNTHCLYRDDSAFYEWDVNDIDFHADGTWNGRDWCYWWFSDYRLCSNCRTYISKQTGFIEAKYEEE